ncbi:MAG: hypothetical protein ACKN9U_18375, partial [Pirellulaceae bacterium]
PQRSKLLPEDRDAATSQLLDDPASIMTQLREFPATSLPLKTVRSGGIHCDCLASAMLIGTFCFHFAGRC